MTTTEAPVALTEPIYDNALLCSTLFDQFMAERGSTSREYRHVEDLRGQFNQWAAYLGAFAAPRSSLDARLGPHPSIRDMVVELLQVIRRNVQWGMANPFPCSFTVGVFHANESNAF